MSEMTDIERDAHIWRLFTTERCNTTELAEHYRVHPVHVLHVVRARAARTEMVMPQAAGREVVHG